MSAAVKMQLVPPFFDMDGNSDFKNRIIYQRGDFEMTNITPSSSSSSMIGMRVNPLSISTNNTTTTLASLMSPRMASQFDTSDSRKSTKQNEEYQIIVYPDDHTAPVRISPTYKSTNNLAETRSKGTDLVSTASSFTNKKVDMDGSDQTLKKRSSDRSPRGGGAQFVKPRSSNGNLLSPFRVCTDVSRMGTPPASLHESGSAYSFPISCSKKKKGVTWCSCIDDEGSVERAVRHSKRTRKVPTRSKKSGGHKKRSHRSSTKDENKVSNNVGGLSVSQVNYGSQEEDDEWYQQFYEMTLKKSGLKITPN